ncbi:GNAT family N-acetyltransferase [bacterium]|nr:MAG: GNAT family N-acetyltransferase [bacterium]
MYVAESSRRTGIARTLYASLSHLLAKQRYYRAYAGITLPNEASVALHGAVGFEPVGVYRGVAFKLDRWCDVS